VKLTTHLHVVPMPRNVELYFHSPICLCLYDVLLNWVWRYTVSIYCGRGER
jgi:hypothetical protein